MDYKDKYNAALERARKELQTCGSQDCEAARQIFRLFPELNESEDEKMRKSIIYALRNGGFYSNDKMDEAIAWLEKQKDISSVERVFRPIVGCNIADAAAQAIKQQQLGYKVVLAFNGAYIRVEEKTVDDIVNEYYSWLKKQGEQRSSLPKWRYKRDDTPLLRDSLMLNKYGCVLKTLSGAIISDAWVLDYDELAKLPKEEPEKQGEQKPVDKVELKFKVGDWIINQEGKCYQIKSIYNVDGGYYIVTDKDGEDNRICFSIANEYFHHWTIEDAKDGDVL